jgi:hypothetical protein
VSEDDLLDELERIWDETLAHDGRRPYKQDLARYESRFSQGPYYRRWGSWIRACEAVLERSRKEAGSSPSRVQNRDATDERPGRRTSAKGRIPLSVRYSVLRRDGFRARLAADRRRRIQEQSFTSTISVLNPRAAKPLRTTSGLFVSTATSVRERRRSAAQQGNGAVGRSGRRVPLLVALPARRRKS